jgi:1-carboxybiuret hydrolase subunit AtzG-like protein
MGETKVTGNIPASPEGEAGAEGEAAAVLDAMAPALGLEVDPGWRAGVIAHWQATARAARLVLAFPLDDEVEPAPVFRA